MKTHAAAFVAGIAFAVLVLAYAGPEFLIQTGFRYEAARSEYAWQGQAVESLDVSGVTAILAETPHKKVKR